MSALMAEGQRPGWWSAHDYHRRSVKRLEGWVGWDKILGIMQRAGELASRRRGPDMTLRDTALPAYLMAGGFRVSELVHFDYWKYDSFLDGENLDSGLKLSNIEVLKEGDSRIPKGRIKFNNVLALKSYKTEKDGSKTRIKVSRSFAIPYDEPIVPAILEYLDLRKAEGATYLFEMTSTRAYQIVTGAEPSVWDHWFRSMRASQLGEEYRYGLHDIAEFYRWSDLKTAARYAHKSSDALFSIIPDSVRRVGV